MAIQFPYFSTRFPEEICASIRSRRSERSRSRQAVPRNHKLMTRAVFVHLKSQLSTPLLHLTIMSGYATALFLFYWILPLQVTPENNPGESTPGGHSRGITVLGHSDLACVRFCLNHRDYCNVLMSLLPILWTKSVALPARRLDPFSEFIIQQTSCSTGLEVQNQMKESGKNASPKSSMLIK